MSSTHNPRTQPLRVMTSPLRARTEPGPARGFLRSMLRYRDIDGLDEGIMMLSEPEKQATQEEQDVEDERARKRAMRNLVNSWQERLQLISVITTFFASTEAAMLVNTKPAGKDDDSGPLRAANACLLGALLMHVYAAVLSFLGAFLLIRYKLKEATREEMIVEGMKIVNSPSVQSMTKDIERGTSNPVLQRIPSNNDTSTVRKPADNGATKFGLNKRNSFQVEPPVISTHPHLEQVGPFMSSVSSHLLSRTHSMCVSLAAMGFVLAIIGIITYAWATQPRAVSIFASACLGGCVLAMSILLI